MTDLTKDNLFIKRFNAGEQHAFKELFHRYYKPLCSYVYAIIKDVEATDDIVQDLFLVLWNRKADFDHINRITSFLFVSARHASFNLLDHEEVKLRKIGEYLAEYHGEETEERILIEEFDHMLSRWVESLPTECGRIMKLTLAGKKNKEIADELAISVQTVKNQKVKGFKILRTLYKQDYLLIILFINLFKYLG